VNNVEKFLEFLYDGLDGYVAVATIKDGKESTTYFQWPSEKDSLPLYIEARKDDGNIYIVPAILKARDRKKLGFKASNVIWADYDGVTPTFPQDFPVGNCVVRSSSTDKCHIYWKLDQPLTNQSVLEDYNRRLAYGTGGDISAWDCTQLLRPPDTINHKYQHRPETALDYLDPGSNGLSAFSLPSVQLPESYTFDSSLPSIGILLKDLDSDLKGLFTAKVFQPNRSSFLMAAGYKFIESGYTPEQTVALLIHLDESTVRKFTGRQDSLQRYMEIATIAFNKAEPLKKFTPYKFLDVLNSTETIDFLVDGWLHKNGLMLMSGSPGVGKTQLAMQLGYCLSVGEPFLGRKVFRPLSVMTLSLEMRAVELKYIIQHQIKGFANPELWNENSILFDPIQEELSVYGDLIKAYNPDVVIIDSVSELATDDLKESEARKITRWWDKIRYDTDTAIVVVHHDRKPTDGNKQPKSLGDIYGSFLFTKTPETVVTMWEDKFHQIELIALKARMSKKESIPIVRNENLWFDLRDTKPGKEKNVDSKHTGDLHADGEADLGF
jgi:archaellum biogenesis ATPase FlaH